MPRKQTPQEIAGFLMAALAPPRSPPRARYMGEDRAEEFGRRNAVPGELLVRVTPDRIIAEADVAGY